MFKSANERKARREAKEAMWNEMCTRTAIFRVGQ